MFKSCIIIIIAFFNIPVRILIIGNHACYNQDWQIKTKNANCRFAIVSPVTTFEITHSHIRKQGYKAEKLIRVFKPGWAFLEVAHKRNVNPKLEGNEKTKVNKAFVPGMKNNFRSHSSCGYTHLGFRAFRRVNGLGLVQLRFHVTLGDAIAL